MKLLSLGLTFWMILNSASASYALASQDRGIKSNVSTVITGGAYGLLAGTVSGLVTWPIYQSDRAIAIAAVIGMYLGLVVGVYYITSRDDPQNPLRRASLLPATVPSDPHTIARVDFTVMKF